MRVEFCFDFSCPFAYIASTRIEALCADAGAELVWRPVLLGGVFRSIGAGDGPMASMGAAKARHNLADMARWAEHHGIPLAMPKGHPNRTVRALRALLSLPEPSWPAVIHELYRTYWVGGDDVSKPEVVDAALARAGVAPEQRERALAANDDPEMKAELRRRTDEAVERGVFGVPAMFVSSGPGEPATLYWGQDRLNHVRAALGGWVPEQGAPAPELRAVADRALSPDRASDDTSASPTVEFWYDFSSPFAYLGATQIEEVAARAGARLVWRPMLLGAVFRDIGMANVPLFAMAPSKRTYLGRDLERSAAYWGVPFKFATRFPMRTITALRLALQAGDRIGPLSLALFRALWADDRDIDDRDVLADILTTNGFDADAMLAGTKDPAVKQRLIDNTGEAVSRGVFGAPSSIVSGANGDLLFWGQDRLILAEAALRGWRPGA